jgi:hypothetical protein
MILLLAFQLAAVQSDKAKAATDTNAMLSAFKEVCWSVPHYERLKEEAGPRGWQVLKAGTHASADRLRAEIEADPQADSRVKVAQFEKSVSSRKLFVTLSRRELTDPAKNGFGETVCMVNDFEARPFDVSAVFNWLDRRPLETWYERDGALSFLWGGERRSDPTLIQVTYVPPNAHLARNGIHGVQMNATEYGDKDDVDPR